MFGFVGFFSCVSECNIKLIVIYWKYTMKRCKTKSRFSTVIFVFVSFEPVCAEVMFSITFVN